MNTNSGRRLVTKAAIFATLLAGLAGCGTGASLIDQVTGKNDVVLPGRREAVLNNTTGGKLATEPVVIPTAITNASWSQPGGVPSNAMFNLSLSRQLKTVFAVSAGKGSSGDSRLTASPIVVAGRVFVLDSHSSVRAFNANTGKQLWAVSLVPKGRDSDDAFGGGIASDGQNVYVTTAFGEVVALTIGGGAQVWRQKVSAAVKTAPTVAAGQVYFATSTNRVYALSTATGAILWQYEGNSESASAISNTAPAVSGGIVIVPQSSGDLSAFSARGGQRLWNDTLTSISANQAGILNDIAGRPLISRGQVIAIGHSGRIAAFSLKDGVEMWSRNFAGNQSPWISGEYVFIISQRKRFVAMERRTGRVKWVTDMPGKSVWAGPVMGGGRLIAVSSKGGLASFSPQTGKLIKQFEAGSRFYIPPVIAGNTVYLLDDSGKLIAMR